MSLQAFGRWLTVEHLGMRIQQVCRGLQVVQSHVLMLRHVPLSCVMSRNVVAFTSPNTSLNDK